MAPNNDDFQKGLDQMLETARNRGATSTVVKAGDLHRLVGGYPGPDNRIPVCCGVMRKNMKESDKVLPNALKKDGATFQVRYNL